MANETTNEILVREISASSPDGKSVNITEHIAVQIIWPQGKPKNEGGYVIEGSWRVSR